MNCFKQKKPEPCSWGHEKKGAHRDFPRRMKSHIVMEGTE